MSDDIQLPPLPSVDIDGSQRPQVWFTLKDVEAYARAAVLADREAHHGTLTARVAHYEKRSLPEYEAAMIGCEENDPIERLRFFCSIAMNGEDWLDVEPFFDAITARLAELEAALGQFCQLEDWHKEDWKIVDSEAQIIIDRQFCRTAAALLAKGESK